MNRIAIFAAAFALTASPAALAQDNVTDVPPRPLNPSEDPVNVYVAATTVAGLVVSLSIDGRTVKLDRAQPARIPKPRPSERLAGDTVTISGLGAGTAVASVTVPDQTVVVIEEGGEHRAEQRTIDAMLPTPRPIDTIEVRVSTNGASARFDVRSVYAEICRAAPREPPCAGRTE